MGFINIQEKWVIFERKKKLTTKIAKDTKTIIESEKNGFFLRALRVLRGHPKLTITQSHDLANGRLVTRNIQERDYAF